MANENKRNTVILIAIMVVLIGGAAALYNTLSQRVSPMEEVEAPETASASDADDRIAAPDFTVLDWDENPVKLSDQLGTPVVLNFWASWCPPCKQEMPHFDQVAGELGDQVAFMMVDMVNGMQEKMTDGMAYIEEQGFSFPVYFDTTQEVAYLYGVSSIPVTLFIDREGYVVTGSIGMISEANLRRGIEMITEGD